MKKYVSTTKGFNVMVGLEFVLVLVLSFLLARFATQHLIALNNAALVVVVGIVMFIIGAILSNKVDPRVAFAGQCVALVPIATVLCVLFGGITSFFGAPIINAIVVLAAGLAVVTLAVNFKPDLFKDKGTAFIAILAIIVLCDLLGIVFKWQSFNLVRLIIIVIIGALYADCWHYANDNPRTPLGVVDAGCMLFVAPINVVIRFFERFKTKVGERTSHH